MEEMKKGGYTLFSDKTRKMLLAVGLSMLSVGVLATTVNAAPIVTAECKKTVNMEQADTDVTYQLTLKEEEEGLHIENLYCSTDGINYVAVPEANKLVWQVNEDNTEILAVVKVSSDVVGFKVRNDNAVPDESEALEVSGAEEADGIIIDNTAPNPSWFYKNLEGNYIQFEATDATKIYRVADDDGQNRVIIDESEQDKLLTAKYELRPEDETFYIYDILGNKKEVRIADIAITYTIAAKNADGTIVALNMRLPTGAEVTSITTVEGVDITTEEGIVQDTRGGSSDLVAVYTNVPEGTTFVNVNYVLDDVEYVLPVALDLDLTSPVLVQRDAENDGGIVKSEGVARAYKNSDSTKAIVEVCDFGSAITKIVACTGTGNEIVESDTLHQIFDVENLPTSVLQLIDLPENATYIRVYDGIGNKHDIDLASAVTVDDNTIPAELLLEREGDHVNAIFRDRQAGIQKLVRAKPEDAVEKAVDEDEADISYVPEVSIYDTLATFNDIARKYPVTEQVEELPIEKLQGVPEMTVVDVFGNTATQNLNDELFENTYIYVNVASADPDDVNTSEYVAVKVSDARRIKKITATVIEDVEVDGEIVPTEVEKILEVFELGQAKLEVPDIHGPIDLDRVYEIGDGSKVTKVTVYHYNGDVTQNIIELDEDNQITPAERVDYVEIEENPDEPTDKYDVRIKYGIRKIEYSDGCVIEFFEDFPKEVSVHKKDKDEELLDHVIITDGLGYTYDVMDPATVAAYAPAVEP